MLFDSLQFLIFFTAVFFLYFTIPARFQKWLLLIASCYFYMAFVPYYIAILFFLITIDFFLAQQIQHATGKHRAALFSLSLMANIGTLFFFKYFNFFNQNVAELAHFIHWNYPIQALRILLPLGLSFHVFQSLSYVIEVYKGNYKAEQNYPVYALYVMFFPQLVAGPIERPSHLLPQLHAEHFFDQRRVVSGLRRMLWGFFKKLVISNPLAVMVNFIYAHAATADASVLLLAVILFSFELYADFSGYCDIAIGGARVLGIELTENFTRPYFSRSIAELWRRWHISLSAWFRDYVFLPLAHKGRRLGYWWSFVAIVITFMMTGIWHGAGWNYAAMGALFGVVISIGQFTMKWRSSIWKYFTFKGFAAAHSLFQIAITFTLTSLIWVFFRSTSLHQAIAIVQGLVTRWSSDAFTYLTCKTYCAGYLIGISRKDLGIVLVSILILVAVEFAQEKGFLSKLLTLGAVSWPLYYSLIVWILWAGYLQPQTFIYFQF